MARYAFGGSQILHTRSAQIARRANLSQVSRLRRRANQNDVPAYPASMKRDVTANRHERGAGMRWTQTARQTNVPCADGEVAWSRPPDAEVKLAMMLRITPATVTTKPDHRLFDSHILEPQSGAVFDAAEGFEAYSHHLRTGLSIIGGPSSKPGNDPCSEGERTF